MEANYKNVKRRASSKHHITGLGVDRFDRTYNALETDRKLSGEDKRVDFVLVHENPKSIQLDDDKDKKLQKSKEFLRSKFERALRDEGFTISSRIIGKKVYKRLHC